MTSVARRAAAALLAAVLATAAGACSPRDEDAAVPTGCQATPETVTRALQSAPEQVTLGGNPISQCFTRSGNSGDVQSLGFAFTDAAAELSGEARQRPEGDAAVELGYLVGAVRAGSDGTQGIHEELARRVEQELTGVDTDSEAFTTGEEAGRESG